MRFGGYERGFLLGREHVILKYDQPFLLMIPRNADHTD